MNNGERLTKPYKKVFCFQLKVFIIFLLILSILKTLKSPQRTLKEMHTMNTLPPIKKTTLPFKPLNSETTYFKMLPWKQVNTKIKL